MNYHATPEIERHLAAAPVAYSGEWTAIVLAGQRPGIDPLAHEFGQEFKALVEIAGRSMLSRVIDTLMACPSVGRIVILAQTPEKLLHGDLAWAARHDRIVPIESSGGIAQSIATVIASGVVPWPVFVTTGDHPLLTPEMVERFLAEAGEHDLSIGAVERRVVEARYATTRRTWLKFADGAYSGANMFALRNARTAGALELWARAEEDRKQALRLFLHFGPVLAARAITRTIGFAAAIAAAGRRLGVSARLVDLEFPEAAIDVDKRSDHTIAEAILRRRETPASDTPASGLSVFDLDRTLTRKPTYTAFLVFAALRRSPWRLAFVPLVIVAMLAYLSGAIPRKRLKELQHSLLLGPRIRRSEIDRLARDFALAVHEKGICRAGLARIRQERDEGRRVILASAANAYYLDAIAAQIGIGEVIATRSSWQNDCLVAAIDGQNCYGKAKRDMLAAYLDTGQWTRDLAHVRFFSDHASDLPTFEWADEAFAVNPSRRLMRIATSRGWPVLRWR